MMEPTPIEGRMYTVKFKTDPGNWRWYVKEFSASFIHEDSYGNAHWNLRPLAGSTSIPKSNILDIRESEPGEGPKLPISLGLYKEEDWR